MAKRSHRRALPDAPVETQIESFSHDGRGVAHVDGRAVFIDGALPGETVRFRYTDIRRHHAQGRIDSVVHPSDLRIEPVCPHAGICGGCSLQHLSATSQIETKQQLLIDQLQRLGNAVPAAVFPPLTGPQWGYRHKARLGVKRVIKKGKVLVGFREKSSAFLAELTSCPVLHPSVGERLSDLAELIEGLSIRDHIPQIEVAVGESVAALVFRVLRDPGDADRLALIAFGEQCGFAILLQPAGPDSIVALHPNPAPPLDYSLPGFDVRFRFAATDFTQVNPEINRKMVDRVLELLAPQASDRVLDLFCGIGNFTLPIGRKAAAVVGVEGNAVAVARAHENAVANGLTNVQFHLADLTQTPDPTWASGRFNKVLLDPSRAGAFEVLETLAGFEPERIVYVSCNPSTLARDAGELVNRFGYRLLGAGVMDMFPHTAHVESLAVFERASGKRR